MKKRFVKTVVGAAALGFVASAALAAGPFAQFGGQWRGTGRISDTNGRTELLRCRSTDSPSQDGVAMNLSLVCASDSYRVDLHLDLFTDGQSLHGSWRETTRNASGDIQGEIQPSLINAVASAPGFNAHVVARVSHGHLDVDLNATGASINRVSVSMKRT